MRRSGWMLSWSSWESMGYDARESCGGFSMLWVVFVTTQGCFWPLMRRTHVESLRVRLFLEGWTGMGFWMRVRTSLIMSWPSLWRTSLSAVFRHLSSSREWPSPSTMLECLLGRGISGKIIFWYGKYRMTALLLCCLILILVQMISLVSLVVTRSWESLVYLITF